MTRKFLNEDITRIEAVVLPRYWYSFELPPVVHTTSDYRRKVDSIRLGTDGVQYAILDSRDEHYLYRRPKK